MPRLPKYAYLKPDSKKVGEYLRILRKDRNLTLSEVEERTKIPWALPMQTLFSIITVPLARPKHNLFYF